MANLTTDLKVGVSSPWGAQTIKAVTSGNVAHGLRCIPQMSPIFPNLGPWCSRGARLFRNVPCRRVLTSAFASRLVWIMV
jgi:hypothetical protein